MYTDGEFLTAWAQYRDPRGTAWAEVFQLKMQGSNGTLQDLDFGSCKSILALVIGCQLGLFSMDLTKPFLPTFRGYLHGQKTISIGKVADSPLHTEGFSWIVALNLEVLVPGWVRLGDRLAALGAPTTAQLMHKIFNSLDAPIDVIGKYVTCSQMYASSLSTVLGTSGKSI